MDRIFRLKHIIHPVCMEKVAALFALPEMLAAMFIIDVEPSDPGPVDVTDSVLVSEIDIYNVIL